MKMNPDCVRALLLTVEENCDFNHFIEYRINKNGFDKLSSYSHDEILYHIKQCFMNEMITGVHYYDGDNCVVICDLTPKGHEFLANIRSEKIWNQTKRYAKK